MSAPLDDIVLKLILVGDSGVGKSCLLKSFMGDPFKGVYTSTIGVDFEIKPMMIGGRNVNLQIWDTAGQERFRTITTSYYRSADAIMLCFGLNDSASFAHCEAWMEDVRLYSGKDVTIELIGNKCDLTEERVVDHKEAKAYAERNGFMYEETSAKTRINVDRALTRLTQAVYDKKKEKMNAARPTTASNTNDQKNVNLQSTTEPPASSCPC